jgi:hypothetical protein
MQVSCLKVEPAMVNERPLTYSNVKYGMLVEVLHEKGGGYHAGCKVHFFNKKGVLVGNYYQFIPYNRLRLRGDTCAQKAKDRQYPRYFMGKNYLKSGIPICEKVKTWLFIRLCNTITGLIKFTQKYMD